MVLSFQLDEKKIEAIAKVYEEILRDELDEHFPLAV